MKTKLLFGDIVVVNENQIGVVVKCWDSTKRGIYYEVYNRMTSSIKEYLENEVERCVVRHKYLDDKELKYQNS